MWKHSCSSLPTKPIVINPRNAQKREGVDSERNDGLRGEIGGGVENAAPRRLHSAAQVVLLFDEGGAGCDLERVNFAVGDLRCVDDGADDVGQRVVEVALTHQFHVGLHGFGGQRIPAERQVVVICQSINIWVTLSHSSSSARPPVISSCFLLI